MAQSAGMDLTCVSQKYHLIPATGISLCIPGEHGKFDLFTLGADAKEGGEGEDQDIVSWQ